MRIIAQSQFDVNQENIEGIVLDGPSTGNKMVFSRWISDLDSASESRCLIETFHASDSFLPCLSRGTSMYE